MAQNKKAQIKKLVADLHSDPKAMSTEKGHRLGQAPRTKALKGVKNASTYRPKI